MPTQELPTPEIASQDVPSDLLSEDFARQPTWAILLLLVTLPWAGIYSGLYYFNNFWVTYAVYQFVVCLIPSLLFFKPTRRLFTLKKKYWRDVLFLVALGNAVVLIGWPLVIAPWIDANNFHMLLTRLSFDGTRDYWPFAVLFCIGNPICEEMFWRGLVYRGLKRLMMPVGAVLVSSFFFGAWHWLLLQTSMEPSMALMATGTIVFGGILFAACYEITGSLLSAMIVHGIGFDMPLMIILTRLLNEGVRT